MWEEHDAALLDTLGTLLQKSREKEVSLVAGLVGLAVACVQDWAPAASTDLKTNILPSHNLLSQNCTHPCRSSSKRLSRRSGRSFKTLPVRTRLPGSRRLWPSSRASAA